MYFVLFKNDSKINKMILKLIVFTSLLLTDIYKLPLKCTFFEKMNQVCLHDMYNCILLKKMILKKILRD